MVFFVSLLLHDVTYVVSTVKDTADSYFLGDSSPLNEDATVTANEFNVQRSCANRQKTSISALSFSFALLASPRFRFRFPPGRIFFLEKTQCTLFDLYFYPATLPDLHSTSTSRRTCP